MNILKETFELLIVGFVFALLLAWAIAWIAIIGLSLCWIIASFPSPWGVMFAFLIYWIACTAVVKIIEL